MNLIKPKINYIIESKRLIIKPIVFQDITEKYIEWLNNKEVNKYLSTKEGDKNSIINYINNLRKSNLDLLAIFNNNFHIGNLSITSLNSRSACYGLMIGDFNARLMGLGGEASLAILKLMFDKLSIERLEVLVAKNNESACRNLLDLGFSKFDTNDISAVIFELNKKDWNNQRITNSRLYNKIRISKN